MLVLGSGIATPRFMHEEPSGCASDDRQAHAPWRPRASETGEPHRPSGGPLWFSDAALGGSDLLSGPSFVIGPASASSTAVPPPQPPRTPGGRSAGACRRSDRDRPVRGRARGGASRNSLRPQRALSTLPEPWVNSAQASKQQGNGAGVSWRERGPRAGSVV